MLTEEVLKYQGGSLADGEIWTHWELSLGFGGLESPLAKEIIQNSISHSFFFFFFFL